MRKSRKRRSHSDKFKAKVVFGLATHFKRHSNYMKDTSNALINLSSSKDEHFISIEAPLGLFFTDSLQSVLQQYEEALSAQGLSKDTEIAIRYYLSDITNQACELREDSSNLHRKSFTSVLGQPPASGAKIALLAYHVAGDEISKELLSDGTLLVKHADYTSIWHAARPKSATVSFYQTDQIFDQLNSTLAQNDADLKNNSVRTWIYVRDVDNNYQGMVDSRIAVFNNEGLTKATHYIASTGIEGCGETVSDLVFMDSLSISGMAPEQRTFLTAEDYLCPTHDYNVTFERGTTIRFGDRSHHYISGTASIDREGNVLYLGDVARQTKRTLENIQALLQSGGSDLDELKSITVYLRDVGDYPHVKEIVESVLLDDVAVVYVRGAVCRPQWLVEIEGVAISPFGNPDYYSFA